MYLWMLISLIGCTFMSRTLLKMHRQKIISKNQLTKIGTVSIFIFMLMMFLFRTQFFLIWLISLIMVILLFLAARGLYGYRRLQFEKSIVLFLDQKILGMQSGNSYRESFRQAVEQSAPLVRPYWQEIYQIVVFSQQSRGLSEPLMSELTKEFCLIDKSSHKNIERLQFFRRQLRLQQKFRHKSGQALMQIRAQSLLMSLIFIALIVFVGQNFGYKEHIQLLLPATFLFLLASIWIWRAGRVIKWQI